MSSGQPTDASMSAQGADLLRLAQLESQIAQLTTENTSLRSQKETLADASVEKQAEIEELKQKLVVFQGKSEEDSALV